MAVNRLNQALMGIVGVTDSQQVMDAVAMLKVYPTYSFPVVKSTAIIGVAAHPDKVV